MTDARLLAALLAGTIVLAAPALALEDWQLGHGPFVTASDVRAHNALGADIAEMDAALAAPDPDFAAALDLYAFGKNFPWRDRTHSLGRFGDDYNGKIAAVLPAATAHFGGPSFQSEFMYAALAGTSRFQDADPAERVAAADGGALATVINWTRFELAESRGKATGSTPNWSLENGSPKNWNEIFAFHYGPGGGHSVHAALAAAGAPAVNAALYDALARGQEQVVAEAWPSGEADEVAALLDRGSVLLLAAALADAAAAEGSAREAARARAAGLWLGAAEAVLLRDPAAGGVVEAALVREAPPETLAAAATATAAVLDAMPAL